MTIRLEPRLCFIAVVVGIAGAIVMSLCFKKSRLWLEDLFFISCLRFDFATAVLLTAAIGGFIYSFSDQGYLEAFLKENGMVVYAALLPTFASLLGFAVAILAIVCTVLPTIRNQDVMDSDQFGEFVSSFTFTIRTFGACTLISLGALFLNYSNHLRFPIFFVLAFAMSLAFPGAIRAALSLELVVKLMAKLPTRKRKYRPKNRAVIS